MCSLSFLSFHFQAILMSVKIFSVYRWNVSPSYTITYICSIWLAWRTKWKIGKRKLRLVMERFPDSLWLTSLIKNKQWLYDFYAQFIIVSEAYCSWINKKYSLPPCTQATKENVTEPNVSATYAMTYSTHTFLVPLGHSVSYKIWWR
jgi:hypothetical protein